jgi:ketosteroid isomerase-like protein
MSQANLDLLRRFAEEVVAGNRDGLRRLLHDDVVVHEAPALPYGGDHHGPEAWIKLFETVQETWEFTETFRYTYYDSDPDTVILQVEVDALAAATRKPIRLRLAEIFTIRDGKIAELDVYYWDTAAMLEALGAG